jgi:hypothetical protein
MYGEQDGQPVPNPRASHSSSAFDGWVSNQRDGFSNRTQRMLYPDKR